MVLYIIVYIAYVSNLDQISNLQRYIADNIRVPLWYSTQRLFPRLARYMAQVRKARDEEYVLP